MTVKELLTITGGNAKFSIYGITHKDQYVLLAYGRVDDIKFPLVPYGQYEIQHISVSDGTGWLSITLDDAIRFAEVNPDHADITSPAFCGYLENQ